MFVLFLSLFVCLFSIRVENREKALMKIYSEMSDVQLETINKWSQYSSLYLKKNSFNERKKKVPSVG